MKKIPTLFVRGDDFLVRPELNNECAEWISLHALVNFTEKFDGTNARLTTTGGTIVKLEQRRRKSGEYVDIDMADREHAPLIAAARGTCVLDWPDGQHLCEAIGPKIQGNPYKLDGGKCIRFLSLPVMRAAISFDSIRHSLTVHWWMEGVVFHDDTRTRFAKIKRRDFGLQWPPRPSEADVFVG